ncbi:site-specific integrase [Bacillus paranthracis]|uniref:Site-specific integrase n=1 Tax=Bacillus paranthracis TaxID=2026186 RepID=A0AAJ1KH84_9BACI|nr:MULTISPECIES: site-specific integrase [Bacillus cereus group]ADY24868.1 integrase family protein [Bacillus thuringiensis serovar finitimus YBT-020]MRC73991.1 tyrosine-type recombinase/integrase [Bacillus thuringiensis]OTX71526.1 integrase [Bacillus thuringiensis serovar finitimus]MCR6801196.1 site-specific integrase [Bacillus paranthracis]MDG0950924.1 site-specific integrase [Bacillus paranthracis]
MDKQSGKDNLPIIINKGEDIDTYVENIRDMVPFLHDSRYVDNMEEKIEVAEKEGNSKYTYLSDMEVIYHFVHLQKDMDEKKNRKEGTKKSYISEILSFCQCMVQHAEEFELNGEEVQQNDSLLKTLQPWHIRKYNAWLKQVENGRNGDTYAVATLAKKTVLIRSFLKHLHVFSYIEKPLYEELQRANVNEQDRPNRDLSYEEVMKILGFYKEQGHLVNYTILLALASTGARIQELCTTRVKDLHYDGKHWLKVIGKGSKVRELFISEHLYECICEMRRRRGFQTVLDRGDESPLFVNQRGNFYNSKTLSNQVTDMIKKTNLEFLQYRENPVTAHTFRHAFAIMAVEQGNADLYHLMQTLGHENIQTTKIYLEKHMKRKNNVGTSFADMLV